MVLYIAESGVRFDGSLKRKFPRGRLQHSTTAQHCTSIPWEHMSSDMKILTVNFLTCAVKTCKASPLSFPLHFKDAELEQSDIEYNPSFLRNILPRIDWEAFKVTANEVCILCKSLVDFAFLFCKIVTVPCTVSISYRSAMITTASGSPPFFFPS